MGGVLVRKNISYQQPIGDSGFYLDPMASKGKNKSLPDMSGTDRSPAQMAVASSLGAQAQQELQNLPSPGSISDFTERQNVGVQRASAKDAMSRGAPTSHYERYGADRFARERDKGADIDTANRAGIAAGKVGVKGRRFGGKLGGALAGGLGILSAATALDEAGASGQSFDRALTGAGLAGYSTGSTMQQTLTPHLRTAGGAIGSKFASPKYVRPPVAVKPTTTAQPTVAQPTTPPVAVLPSQSIYTNHGGPNAQLRHASRTPQQLRDARDHINTSANFNMGTTARQDADLRHIDRQLNPTDTSGTFNPQVQEGAMDMFNAPEQRLSYTPGSNQFNVPGSQPKPEVAEPTKPVAVEPTQTKLDAGAAAAPFKPPVGSVQHGEETGALVQQAGAEGQQVGQKFLELEEKENQTAEPGTTGKAGA